MTTTPSHWIRRNDTSRMPRCFVYLDTESQVVEDRLGPTQVWRLAVTCIDRRKGNTHEYRDPEWGEHRTPDELWDWIEAHAMKEGRTVVIAHNVAYDLRIADAFEQLTTRGWRLDRIRLDSEQAMARWRRGRQTILCIDSMSWFPAALETIGDELGIPKHPLPTDASEDAAWWARCRRDVEILRTAWRRMLAWLVELDAGTWQPSGAGMSWTVWRHRFYTHRVLVDTEHDDRPMEREAIWTGRCEAWRHGKLTDGPFYEFDFTCSYLTIARDIDLPQRPVAHPRKASLKEVLQWAEKACVLTSVTVSTTEPVLPARSGHGIYWPVGTFETTVWDRELRLALSVGATVDVQRAVVYSRAPILHAFACWCMPLAMNVSGTTDPVVQRVAKHWARALIGRFGVRYTTWEPFGEAIEPGLALHRAVDADTDEQFRLLTLGRDCLREGPLVEGENAVPSVMGYVMSEARVRLWRAMECAGFEHVAYVDTDGLVVDEVGAKRLHAAGVEGLRLKASYKTIEVLGPRQCVFGGELRMSGVPRRAKRVGPQTWEGEVWPHLGTSLARSEPASVRVQRRRIVVRGVDHRRQHVAGGATAALVASPQV